MFPACLDDKSVDVIIKIAKKGVDLDKVYEKLSESNSERVFYVNSKPDIKTRLSNLAKTIRIRRPDYSNKKLSWLDSEILQIEDHPSNQLFDSLKIEENIRGIKNEIFDLQNEEVVRLTKICLKNGKDLKLMISYVVGVECIEKFMVLTVKELRKIESVKKLTSTFSFAYKYIPKSKSKIL